MMATNWRLVARLMGKRWSPTVCRSSQVMLEPRDPVLRTSVGVPSGSCCWTTQSRAASTNTMDAPELPPRGLTRFWKWFNDEIEEEPMSEVEATERQALLQKVQDMYFAKPPASPGLEFYKETFSTLMKYNDGLGVATLWNSMSEMQVEPDDELRAKIVPFLEEARRRSWFE
ncbi:uncharacterized protein LOC135350180 [Halichondria panicea]|uniref:uncharacterized protein LOC135350180 n=1 Tax=Halichondria panicea TaxID=6063 RepID=UPI00312B94AA